MKKLILLLFFIVFTSNAHAQLSSEDWKKIDLMISKYNEFGANVSEKQKKCITEVYSNSSKLLRSSMYNYISNLKKGISKDEQDKIFINKFSMTWDDFDAIWESLYKKCFK